MDKAKELSKNPFKYQNKYDKEMEVFNKIIAKNDKIVDSEKDEKLGKDFETVLLKTKDPIQSHIKALVLRDLGYTDYAQLFFSKAVELGYIIESVAIAEPDVEFDEIQKHIEDRINSHGIEIEFPGDDTKVVNAANIIFNHKDITISLSDGSEINIPNSSLPKLFDGDQVVHKVGKTFFGVTLVEKETEAMEENNTEENTCKCEGVCECNATNEGRNDYYDNLDGLYHRFSGGYVPGNDPTLEDRVEDFIESLDIEFDKQEVRDYLQMFITKETDATLQTTEAIGTINLAEDIAKDLYPKIHAAQTENGSYTVKQLEEEIIGNGGTLEMTDLVMGYLVSMGIDFDNEVDEMIDMQDTEPECINNEEHNWVGIGNYEQKCSKCDLTKSVEENNPNGNAEMFAEEADVDTDGWFIKQPEETKKAILDLEEDSDPEKVWFDMSKEEKLDVYKQKETVEESVTETKVTLATPIGDTFTQKMPGADDFKGHNIFKAEDKPERPAYNIDAVKRMIENDSFLMFSYNNLLSGVFEKDMDLIYNTYIKNDSDYLDKLKTFESYTKMLKENAVVQSMYGTMIEDIIKHFDLNLGEDETELSFAMAEFITENKAKFKSYFALFTPEIKEEFKKYNENSYLENADKLLDSEFNMDREDGENIQTLAETFEVSDQLALLMLNVIKSVYTDYQHKTYTEDMHANSVLFIGLVTLILTTAF